MPRTASEDDNATVRMAGVERALDTLLDVRSPFLDADPAAKRHLIATMTDQQLQTLVLGFNARLRDRDPDEHSFDGETVSTTFLKFPNQRDKPRLLGQTAATLRAVAADPTLDDATALRRVALTAGEALVLIHPFGNGNGRTARFLSYAIDQPIVDTPIARQRLARVAMDKAHWFVSPTCTDALTTETHRRFVAGLPHAHGPVPFRTDEDFVGEYTAAEFLTGSGLDADQALQAATILNDADNGPIALYGALVRTGKMHADLLTEDPSGRPLLRAHAAVGTLGPADVGALASAWDELMCGRVELFLEEMRAPTLSLSVHGAERTVAAHAEHQLMKHSTLLQDGIGRAAS
jgi:hypothetical protein